VFYRNFVPKTHRFLKYSTCKYIVTLKYLLGSLNVVENDTIQSGIHDFLLTFHSNYRPISHCFWDRRRCTSKIANFSQPRAFMTPLKRFPLEFRIGAGVRRNWSDGAARRSKSFKTGLSVLIQYRRMTDTQPASHVAVASTALTTSRG